MEISEELSTSELIDPITLDIIFDPVIAEDNHTYSRSTITRWINQFPDRPCLSPLTGLPMGKTLRPDFEMANKLSRMEEKMTDAELEEYHKNQIEIIEHINEGKN